VEQFKYEGLGDQFEALGSFRQGLRQWDVVAEKRDMLLAEAATARANGQESLAAQKTKLAKEINRRMATDEVWQQKFNKEDLTQNIEEIRAEVGDQTFKRMNDALEDVYRQVALKRDEMYANGLIPQESYDLYVRRGDDHIPAFKTPWEVNEKTGELEYTGGKKFEEHTSSIQGTTEQLLEEVMGSANVAANPFDNAAKFITEGTAEIKRAQIARAVIDTFGPSGMFKKVDNPKVKGKADPGNEFYTILENGEPVTYEGPSFITNSMMMLDKELSRKLLANASGGQGYLDGARAARVGHDHLESGVWRHPGGGHRPSHRCCPSPVEEQQDPAEHHSVLRPVGQASAPGLRSHHADRGVE
jgi:hypothetical protein